MHQFFNLFMRLQLPFLVLFFFFSLTEIASIQASFLDDRRLTYHTNDEWTLLKEHYSYQSICDDKSEKWADREILNAVIEFNNRATASSVKTLLKTPGQKTGVRSENRGQIFHFEKTGVRSFEKTRVRSFILQKTSRKPGSDLSFCILNPYPSSYGDFHWGSVLSLCGEELMCGCFLH